MPAVTLNVVAFLLMFTAAYFGVRAYMRPNESLCSQSSVTGYVWALAISGLVLLVI